MKVAMVASAYNLNTMMSFTLLSSILLLSLFNVVICISEDAKAKVEHFKNEEFRLGNDGSGSYRYSFKTSNGIQREEEGSISKPLHTDDEVLVVRGSYSYLGPDGIMYTVHYIADGNGFQPEGAHINVPPVAPSSGFRKPNTGALVKDTDITNEPPMLLDHLEDPGNQVYHFPSAALASLTGAGLG